MNELPYCINCRDFINSKLEEKIGSDLRFIENKTIAVVSNIDSYAKLYNSLEDVSMQKNGVGNIVFFSVVPGADKYKVRRLWGFQLIENKEEFLSKYKTKLNIFNSDDGKSSLSGMVTNYVNDLE